MLYHFGIVRPNAIALSEEFFQNQKLQNQKFIKYVQECPVKCLWLKSKIAQLSPMPTVKVNIITLATPLPSPIKTQNLPVQLCIELKLNIYLLFCQGWAALTRLAVLCN